MNLVVERPSAGSAPADQDPGRWAFSPRPEGMVPEPSAPAAPDTAMLVITRGPGLTGPVEVPIVTGRAVIGRDPGCDVVLADLTISRRHAELRSDGDGFTVTDLESLNGIFVNRNPVRRARLRDGDTLWIGRFRLVFRTGPRSQA